MSFWANLIFIFFILLIFTKKNSNNLNEPKHMRTGLLWYELFFFATIFTSPCWPEDRIQDFGTSMLAFLFESGSSAHLHLQSQVYLLLITAVVSPAGCLDLEVLVGTSVVWQPPFFLFFLFFLSPGGLRSSCSPTRADFTARRSTSSGPISSAPVDLESDGLSWRVFRARSICILLLSLPLSPPRRPHLLKVD